MEEGEEEVEEEAEEDALGYLTLLLLVPLWIFDLLGGVTPLLQVGLSAPEKQSKHRYVFLMTPVICSFGER